MAGMLRFTTVGQDYPDKRAAGERAADFEEIAQSFAGGGGGGAVVALLAVRRALLLDALPAP